MPKVRRKCQDISVIQLYRVFKYVKKVGPSIRSQINSLKKQSLGIKKGSAIKCGARGCKTCQMLIEAPTTQVAGKKVKLTQGTLPFLIVGGGILQNLDFLGSILDF